VTDQALLETILRAVTLHPDQTRIERTEDERGVLFRIRASKPDMPLLIGKQGKNISAIRLIMKMFARPGQGSKNISLKLEEPAQ